MRRHVDREVGRDACELLVSRLRRDGPARALELAQAYGLPTLAFYGTHNLGLFEFLSGNLPRALELMPSIEQASSDFERGVVGLDRARVLLSAGLVSEADRSLVEMARCFGATRRQVTVPQPIAQLGGQAAQGEPHGADPVDRRLEGGGRLDPFRPRPRDESMKRTIAGSMYLAR